MVLALAVATAALLVLSLAWPYGPDQAIMTQVARAWTWGGAPYADAIDVKGPYAFVPYLAALVLPIDPMVGMRLVDAIAVSVTAAFTYHALKPLTDRATALWAAVLLASLCLRVGYADSAEPDGWFAMITTALVLARLGDMARADGLTVWMAGVAAGVGLLIKPFYVIVALVPLWTLWRHGDRRRLAACAVRVLVGAAAAVLAISAVLWYGGGFDDMLQIYAGPVMLEYRKSAQDHPDYWFFVGWWSILRRSFVVPLVPLAALGLVHLRRADRELAHVLGVWLLASIGLVTLQHRYFMYHAFPALPPVVILAAAGVTSGLRRQFGRGGMVLAGLCSIALLVTVASRPIRDLAAAARAVHERRDPVEAIRMAQPRYGWSAGYASASRMAAYLADVTSPQDRVGTWLYEPSALLLAGVRPAGTIFSFNQAYLPPTPFAESIMARLTRDLVTGRPRYFLVDCWLVWDQNPDADLTRAPRLAAALRADYRLAREEHGLRLYERTTPGRGDATPCGASAPPSTTR